MKSVSIGPNLKNLSRRIEPSNSEIVTDQKCSNSEIVTDQGANISEAYHIQRHSKITL